MDNLEELMTDFYNTLGQIRYPKITTTTIKDIELTILSGENRVSLLSWLLINNRKSSFSVTSNKLQKLKGVVLDEELLKSYSEIGICNDKNLLLGNCPLEKQLPTLRLLLDFIKHGFLESCEPKYNENDVDYFKIYINGSLNTSVCNIESKLNQSYAQSVQYFNNLQKQLDDYKVLSFNEFEVKESSEKHSSEDERKESDDTDQNSLLNFNEEKQKFIETFSSVISEPKFNVKGENNHLHSMNEDINDMQTNFSSLTQFLQAREEILRTNVPERVDKSNTSLNTIIEDTLERTEKATNFSINHNINF